jgi:hypothetical protein
MAYRKKDEMRMSIAWLMIKRVLQVLHAWKAPRKYKVNVHLMAA